MQIKWRRVVSLSLLLLGLVLACTGVILYVAPQGRVAYWSDWHLLGLDKGQYGAIHTVGGFAFLLLSGLHTWYNWKPILNYLRRTSRALRGWNPELAVATTLVAVITVGAGLSLPPFAQMMALGDAATGWWEAREGTPPWGHAELSSLSSVAGKLGLEPAVAVAALDAAGWEVADPELSLLEISRHNDRSPAALYQVLVERAPSPQAGGDHAARPQVPRQPAGLGRRSLADHCQAEGLDLQRSLTLLAKRGLQARPDQTLKQVAAELGMTPADLAALLGEGADEP